MRKRRARDWVFLIFAVLMALLFIRLGIWQLDRLQALKTENTFIQSRLAQAPTELPNNIENAQDWDYRRVIVRGSFDPQHQILLRNRAYNGQAGVHLITPLLRDGQDHAVLVDRGWIPADQTDEASLRQFDLAGPVHIAGIARTSQPQPAWAILADPTLVPGGDPLTSWRVITIERIQNQMPYPLLPIYIEQSEPLNSSPSPRPDPDLDLSEGPHLGYAIQWFAFAAIALVGLIVWWRRKGPNRENDS